MTTPFLLTTNQAYGINLKELQNATQNWSNRMPDHSNHNKEDPTTKYNLSFLFSREADEYGRDIPPSDSKLAEAFSKQNSLSDRAKRKRFACISHSQKPTPEKVSREQIQQWLDQYTLKSKQEHILYSTTSNQMGSKKPTLATLPTTRHDISQKFSSSFHTIMFQDHGLNMALSKSKVHKSLDAHFS
jgi:hypothetical protein